MKKLKQVLLASAILVLTAFNVSAQKGGIKGTVKDNETGETIPFLNIYVSSNPSIAVQTGVEGEYTLELDPGTYEIVFSGVEYSKTNKTVTITGTEMQTLNLSISKTTISTGEIIVKSDKYAKEFVDIISSTEVIKPNILENKAATDVKEALEQAPGLTIVDNEPQLRAGSGYSFGAGSRVMVLVDDLPMLSGDAGRPSWGFIPIENVEQIEVIKGASSVLYGSAALNGVINVRTAYPKAQPVTKVNLSTGIYDKPAHDAAKWWDEYFPFWTNMNFLHSRRVKCKDSEASYFSFVVGGNLFIENNYIGPQPNDVTDKVPEWNALLAIDSITPAQYNDSLDLLSRQLKKPDFSNRARITFNTNAKGKRHKGLSYGLNGNVMYGRSTSTLLWLNNDDGLLRPFPGSHTTTLQTSYNFDPYVSYFDAKNNKFSLNTRIFYQNNNNDNNQANSNTVFYGEFRYLKSFEQIKDFTLSAGLMGNHTIGESELYGGGSATPSNGEQTKRTSSNIALYAQLDKKFLKKLNVTLGARWEYFTLEGERDNKPVFRAGLNYKVLQATYIRASFGQGFRFPTIAERYIQTTVGGVPIEANPELTAEVSWNAEAGIKQGFKIGKKFQGYLDVAGFVQNYKDYVEFIAAQWNEADFGNPEKSLIEQFGLAFKSQNTNDARVSGAEVSLLGGGSITDNFGINVLAGYTWAKPVSLDPHKPFANSYPIPPDSVGPPLNYINTSSDTTNYILKYRYEHLVKVDLELNYKKLSVGGSFKYYSFMQNIDAIFYSPAIEALGLNVREYREKNDHPEIVIDVRISYQIASHSKLGFIINNVNNREYALRPLAMDAPRSYAIQYSLNL